MKAFWAVEIGSRRLAAAHARANGRGAEIVRLETAELSGPEGVREAAARCGLSGGRAVVVVPRRHAIFREFELPEGTPEELAAMARFQAERRLPLPPERVHMAFVELGRAEGKVRMQLAAVPREVLDPAVAALEGAGVKVVGATVSTFALAGRVPPDEAGMVVAFGDGEVEAAGPGTLETAPAAGACAAWARPGGLPDLLRPPEPPRRFRWTRLHRAGALAGAALVLLLVWSQAALADKRRELELKRAALAKLQPQVAEVTRLGRQTALAHQWYRDRNTWLPVLGALRRNVDTSRLWIVTATFEDPGVVRLQGKARDDKPVYELVSALEKTGLFGPIKIERIIPNADRGEYRHDFTIEARLAGTDGRRKGAR
ncbi:MAG TPA: hypothetical protein VNO22_11675 [Planctomycetota bacterium]|nr:hypothetical protein [Planctomycetota bacterium]